MKTPTHSQSVIFRTASAVIVLFIAVTLTHEPWSSLKFVGSSLQGNYHLTSCQTPNPILGTTDVPERYQRDLVSGVSYPTDSRYTLQWIVTPPNIAIERHLPNNTDATFKNQQLPKPADILLHYNYGVAVVKEWGKNIDALVNRPNISRPSIPTPAPMGPPRVRHDRNIAIEKRTAATTQGGQAAGSSKRKRGEERAEGGEGRWDGDDVIMFLWGNTKAAREWHAQKEQERTAYLENWRAAVTGIPDVI